MQPFCWGPLRVGWADRMLQVDFLRPDAMPICVEQTLFLLMSLLPDQALYTKGRGGNQMRQESTGPATYSVSRVRGKGQRPNSFSGTCHGCGK